MPVEDPLLLHRSHLGQPRSRMREVGEERRSTSRASRTAARRAGEIRVAGLCGREGPQFALDRPGSGDPVDKGEDEGEDVAAHSLPAANSLVAAATIRPRTGPGR
ncbi:hypothetical protein [Streptomyces sp. NPDC001970]